MSKISFSDWLRRRRRRYHGPYPALHWKPFLVVAAALVVLTMLVYDAPVGSGLARVSPLAQWFGRQVTDIGKSDWSLGASAFVFIASLAALRSLTGRRMIAHGWFINHIASYIFLTVALSGLSSNLLKRAIGRARPEHFDTLGIFHFVPFAGHSDFESLPSGHATTIGAICMALALLLPRYRLLLGIAAAWLAMTRVMVGAHYPSDVLAGLLFGAWFSLMLAIVYARHGLVFRIGPDGLPIIRQSIVFKGKDLLPAPPQLFSTQKNVLTHWQK